MKKIILFILSIMLIGCMGCGGIKGLTEIRINGETSTDSYIPLVKFRDNDVAVPMSNVLVLLGADRVGNDLKLNDKYFIFDYKHHLVFLEDESGRSKFYQLDYPKRYERWNETNSLLPSEDCLDNDEKYVRWGTKTVVIDGQTLINILHDIGIELQISVDYENEIVYLNTNKTQGDG